MRTRCLLTHPREGNPFWVQLYVQQVGTKWAAMVVPDGASPPEPGRLKGTAFLAESAEEAEWRAVSFLGESMARK